jgi:hypothetical protein
MLFELVQTQLYCLPGIEAQHFHSIVLRRADPDPYDFCFLSFNVDCSSQTGIRSSFTQSDIECQGNRRTHEIIKTHTGPHDHSAFVTRDDAVGHIQDRLLAPLLQSLEFIQDAVNDIII